MGHLESKFRAKSYVFLRYCDENDSKGLNLASIVAGIPFNQIFQNPLNGVLI